MTSVTFPERFDPDKTYPIIVKNHGIKEMNGKQAQAYKDRLMLGIQPQLQVLYLDAQEQIQKLSKQLEQLRPWLDWAAGEGLVLHGVDAAQPYTEIFPEQYTEALKNGEEVHND